MNLTSLFIFSPEVFLIAMILVLLLVDSLIENQKLIGYLTLITLIGTTVLQFLLITNATLSTFGGMYLLDGLACGMKLVTDLLAIVIYLYMQPTLKNNHNLLANFSIVFLFAILGMQIIITGNNLLVLYIGLELLSLSLIGLVALNRDHVQATEASMKYFILSALASGILLYGISFVYGLSGSLSLHDVLKYTVSSNSNHQIIIFGTVFIIAGIAFKLGLVPFHGWLPDVYEGARLPALSVIGSITKIAAVVFAIRLLFNGLIIMGQSWAIMLQLLAVLSLFLGNIVAIMQTNIKRMLAYSTISHMAFVMFGLVALNIYGLTATIFYTISYVLTATAGFGVLLLINKDDNNECQLISDLKGLNNSHPIYAAIILVVMFSMAGIPPFIGFYAKFVILQALVQTNHIALAIFAIILSLIGAFYYLRIVKVMYFDQPSGTTIHTLPTNIITKTILVLNGVLILVFGLLPSSLWNFTAYMSSRI